MNKTIKATFKRRGTTGSYELTRLTGAATITTEEPGQRLEEVRVHDKVKEEKLKVFADRPDLEVTVV